MKEIIDIPKGENPNVVLAAALDSRLINYEIVKIVKINEYWEVYYQ